MIRIRNVVFGIDPGGGLPSGSTCFIFFPCLTAYKHTSFKGAYVYLYGGWGLRGSINPLNGAHRYHMTTENALQYSYKSMSWWQGLKGTEMPVLHCTQKQKVVAVQCKAQGCYMKMMTKGFLCFTSFPAAMQPRNLCCHRWLASRRVRPTLFTRLPEQTGEPTHWCKALVFPCCTCVHRVRINIAVCVYYTIVDEEAANDYLRFGYS